MDALRLLLNVTRSVTGCIPTQERGNDRLAGFGFRDRYPPRRVPFDLHRQRR